MDLEIENKRSFKGKNKLKSFIRGIFKKIIQEVFEYYHYIGAQLYWKIKQFQYWNFLNSKEFKNSPVEESASYLEKKTKIDNILDRFNRLGIPVKYCSIDINDFEVFINKFPKLIEFYSTWGDVKMEKLLEHYLTTKYLDLNKGDVLIDIAALTSPFINIVLPKFGVKGYKLDLVYKPGINKNMIGCNVDSIILPDNFADVLTLHCSFECFQGESDIGFINQAQRILKYGGRVGIIPLYIANDYFISVGQKYDKRKIKDLSAKLAWRDDKYFYVPFSRHYSPESFYQRIVKNIFNLNYEILYFENLRELEEAFIDERFYCKLMFRCFKNIENN